jgi:hypothetical protein
MRRLLMFVLVLSVLSPRSKPAQALTPEQLIARSLEAQGGKENLKAIRTCVVTGTAEVLSGLSGPYQSWAKSPDKVKTRWDMRVITQVRGFDGANGWEEHASVRELSGHSLARMRRDALFSPLLTYSEARVPVELKAAPGGDGASIYVIEFHPPGGLTEQFQIDAQTFLPLKNIRLVPYDEGNLSVTIVYGDYRRVGKVLLPFSIDAPMPDLPISIKVHQYSLNVDLADDIFRNPHAAHEHEPYEVSLSTIPRNVYKETDAFWTQALEAESLGLMQQAEDVATVPGAQASRQSSQTRAWPGGWERHWGIPLGPTESWFFDVVVNEEYGRTLDPVSATLEYYCGEKLVETQHVAHPWLQMIRKFPVSQFAPQPEIFDLRHYQSAPMDLKIDRLRYTLELVTPSGEKLVKSLEVPLSYYHQKHKLIFPIKGKFIITGAHDYYTLGHVYERSQHYAYDIEGLGPNLEFARNDARVAEDYIGWGREVISPADGTVVYARNDVSNTATPREYLKLSDPQFAICGNEVAVDHGDGEFSIFCHMQRGSIRVKKGDPVKQGQVIGLLGSSAAPGFAHLHYQLQAGPDFLMSDGLPSQFDNLRLSRAFGKGRVKVLTPKRGIYTEAE